MGSDSSRNTVTTKMYCANHPSEELSFSTDSNIGANSAYEINVKILIHPCKQCQYEIEKIKNAAKILTSLADD